MIYQKHFCQIAKNKKLESRMQKVEIKELKDKNKKLKNNKKLIM